MSTEQSKHWIIQQLETSKLDAEARLIKLFDLYEQLPGERAIFTGSPPLLAYLSKLANQCHIDQPVCFAQQILLMAQEAWQKHQCDPRSRALQHAKIAAEALLKAQRKNRLRRHAPAYAIAASLFLLIGVSGIMLDVLYTDATKHKAMADQQTLLLADFSQPPASNPMRITEMLAQREKMRDGRCQFPEAIVFSETERGIYLQNVVHGEISANKEVQDVSNRLREFVRCDYTPMLMKNSIS
jgi:hypothetical protein